MYHTENQDKADVTGVLEVMERKLYYYIMYPAMILTTVMGIFLFFHNPALIHAFWFQMKILFLLFLFAYHFYAGHVRKEFSYKKFMLSSKQCRLINEVPTVILLVVIFLVVIKPF